MERRIHSILLVALLVAAIPTCSPLSTFAENVPMSTTMSLNVVNITAIYPTFELTISLTNECSIPIEGACVWAWISDGYLSIGVPLKEIGQGYYRWTFEPIHCYWVPNWRIVFINATKDDCCLIYNLGLDLSMYKQLRYWSATVDSLNATYQYNYQQVLKENYRLNDVLDSLNATYQQALEENHCLNDTLNTLNATYQQTLEDNRCLTLNVEEISPDVDRILIIYRLIDSSGECTEGANVTATFKVAHYMGPLDENCIPPMNLPYEPSRGYNQYLLMFGTEHFSSLSTVIITVTATKDNLTTSHILYLRQPYVMGEQQRRSEKNDLQRIISAKDEFLFLSGLAIVCISVVAAAGILYYRRKAEKRPA